jgi:hypothetical protein
LEADMAGCLTVQYVSDTWYKPIFQRSRNLFNRKDDLLKYLSMIKNKDYSPEIACADDFISRPNYKLFFEKLRIF